MSKPVPCTDDLPPGEEAHFQTGQEVPVADPQATPQSPDLQMDAVRLTEVGTCANPVSANTRQTRAARAQDRIFIQGNSGSITATNLGSSLQPGVILQLGLENHNQVVFGDGGSNSRSGGTAPRHIPNKFNITKSNAEVIHAHMDMVSKELAKDWRRLGREFHLSDPILDQIYLDNQIQGQYEVNYHVLKKWKETCGLVTVYTLACALATIGRGDICDKLRSM